MRYALVIMSLFLWVSTQAQFDTLQGRFINYDQSDGLPVGRITTIEQDKVGYLYLGTGDGVFRFDGLNFSELKNNDGHVFIEGKIRSMLYDSAFNKIYIAGNQGLYVYDPSTHIANKIDTTLVRDLQIVGSTLYFQTRKSEHVLQALNRKTQAVEPIISANNPIRISTEFVVDPNRPNKVYFGFRTLLVYDLTTGLTDTLLSKVDLQNSYIKDFKIKDNNLYIAVKASGLVEYGIETKRYKRHQYQQVPLVNGNSLNHLNFLNDTIMSISTDDMGLGEFNLNTKLFSFYRNNPSDPTSISNSGCHHSFVDQVGNLWSSMSESLTLKEKEQNHFSQHKHNLTKKLGFRAAGTEFVNNQILQCTNQGILTYNKDGKVSSDIRNYQQDEVFTSYSFSGKDEQLYSFGRKSIYHIDVNSYSVNKIIDLARIVQDADIPAKVICGTEIIEDTIFINVYNYLAKYQLPSFTFLKTIPSKNGKIRRIAVYKNRLFLLTTVGLYEITENNEYKKHSILDKYFQDIQVLDKIKTYQDGFLFGSSYYGFVQYNIENQEVLQLNKTNGTTTNQVYTSDIDDQGNIWAASSTGLILYNKTFETVSKFDKRDNLSQNNLVWTYVEKLGQNLMSISSDYSLTTWNPLDMKLSEPADSIYITAVNDEYSLRSKYPSKIGNLFIGYSTFDFGAATSARYYHKLNDGEWTSSRTPGELDLIAMGSGQYTLQLKVIDKFGRIGYSKQYHFSIAFPWHQQWWFLILTVISIIGITYSVLSIITRQRAKTLQVTEEYAGMKKDLENQVLRSQMNPHFLFNSMNAIRYFILSNETKIAANYLTKFSRLIRKILEDSSKDHISLKEELETLDLYVDLEKIRFDHKFEFVKFLELKSPIEALRIPSMVIQPYIENAIIHGINAKESKSTLHLRIVELDKVLIVTIIDDGIGRRKANSLSKHSTIKKESLGQEITRRRLQILSENLNSEIQISDAYPGNQFPGTKVQFLIPKK